MRQNVNNDVILKSAYTVIRESIKGPLGLTHGFVEQGRAMHAGKILCLQSSLGKVNADRPTPKSPRSCRESKTVILHTACK